MKPVINFSPPKTTSSALYFAFGNFENYQQVAIKEWVYLYPLSAFGETTYSDRFSKFYRTHAHKSLWRNIYSSHIKHLQHFLEHESSEYCLEQIKHTQKLIFENHSIENYLDLFNNKSSRFIVDFDVRNFRITPILFENLLNKAPDLVAFCGIRPFMPLLVSRIHELFSWVIDKSENRMFNAIKHNLISEAEYKNFCEVLLFALANVKDYYKGIGGAHLNTSCVPSDFFEQVAISDDSSSGFKKINIVNLSRDLILNTDYVKIFQLLKPINQEVFYFNPARIISNMRDFQIFLNSKGVNTGKLNASIYQSRVRESSSFVVNRFLSSKEIKVALNEIYTCAYRYYKDNIDRNTLGLIFPEASDLMSIDHSMLRSLDLLNEQVVYKPPIIL